MSVEENKFAERALLLLNCDKLKKEEKDDLRSNIMAFINGDMSKMLVIFDKYLKKYEEKVIENPEELQKQHNEYVISLLEKAKDFLNSHNNIGSYIKNTINDYVQKISVDHNNLASIVLLEEILDKSNVFDEATSTMSKSK